jgi:protein arginine kinase activator
MHCGKQEAVVFLKLAVNNKLADVRLCAACAAKKGAGPDGAGIGSLNIPEISGGFREFLPREKTALRCPVCSLTYREFKETGKLGCSGCYAGFEAQLTELFIHAQGSCLHKGQVYFPPAAAGLVKRTGKKAGKRVAGARTVQVLKRLEAALKAAAEREDFETAARLRDQIKKCLE